MSPLPIRRTLTLLPTALAAALLATGCGANAQKDATAAELASVAPIGDTVNLDVADATGMSDAVPTSGVLSDASSTVPGMDPCHPHLFARTGEVVWRLNAVFHRHLRHIEALIKRNPTLLAGDTAVWSQTGSGLEVQRQLTVTRSADGKSYAYQLELAPAGQTPPAWVQVFSGTLTRSGGDATTSPAIRHVAMDFDYDALRTVIPTEKLTGTISVASERTTDATKPAPGVRKITTVTFAGFSFGPSDPHGKRGGTFTHVGEPGVGGSLTFQDAVVLLCPANPDKLVSDTTTVSRWYVAPGGNVHGRADARAASGQFAVGDTWLGVTCYAGARGAQPMASSETAYWAMKLEDSSGATVAGSTHSAGDAIACDAIFGAVPKLTDSSADFDFTKQVSFPNQW
jgi:hypothetical protein